MSGGDVDVAPYLNSRNTIGHGQFTIKFSNPKLNGGTEGYVEGVGGIRWWSKWVECGGVGGGGEELQKMQFRQRKPDDPGQEPDDPGTSG